MKDEIKKYLGKTAIIDLEGLKVEVKILDLSTQFGRLRFLVTPVRGSGEIWKEHLTLK